MDDNTERDILPAPETFVVEADFRTLPEPGSSQRIVEEGGTTVTILHTDDLNEVEAETLAEAEALAHGHYPGARGPIRRGRFSWRIGSAEDGFECWVRARRTYEQA